MDEPSPSELDDVRGGSKTGLLRAIAGRCEKAAELRGYGAKTNGEVRARRAGRYAPTDALRRAAAPIRRGVLRLGECGVERARCREHPAHDRLEEVERQGLAFRVERGSVVELAEARGAIEPLMAAEL